MTVPEGVSRIRAKEKTVIIVGGLGGGTGSGVIPVPANVASQLHLPTVVVTFHPFVFEGQRRVSLAAGAAGRLALLPVCHFRHLDETSITLTNDGIFMRPLLECFWMPFESALAAIPPFIEWFRPKPPDQEMPTPEPDRDKKRRPARRSNTSARTHRPRRRSSR